MSKVKNYDSLDLLKFILCFLVVAIHSDPIYDSCPTLGMVMLGIERLAVPLFFISSGFFLFKKGLDTYNLLQYIKRMGILYLGWFIISLPITIYNRFIVIEGSFLTRFFLFVKSFFFTSTFSGSWFLASCVFCAIFFYAVYRYFPKIGSSTILSLSVFVYLLCVFTSGWGNLMDIVGVRPLYDRVVFYFAKPYTSILAGIPYFAIGKWFAENEEEVNTPNWLWVAILFLCLFAEVLYTHLKQLNNATDSFFMLLPCAYCVFVLFLKLKVSLKHPLELRRSSTIYFFSHFIWLFLIEFVEYRINISIPNTIKYAAAIILCGLTSLAILYLSSNYKIECLKKLY